MKSDRILFFTLLSMVGILLLSAIPLLWLGYTGWAATVVIGFFASFLYIISSYLTIRRAFVKSNTTFLKYVFGGMAFRFISFLLLLFLIYKFTSLPITGFVAAFIVFYVIFQIVEIRFVLIENKKKNSSTHVI